MLVPWRAAPPQVVTLYDNMALRRVLAAGAPLGLTAGGG
jgi:hypothetical protein